MLDAGVAVSRPGRRKCGMKTEIFSRVCGYHRPVKNYNKGKQEEFKDRKVFSIEKAQQRILNDPKPLDRAIA